MSKKKTVGEKIALDWNDLECPYDDELNLLAKRIDRAIRRAQARAWDECYVRICESDLCIAADLKVPRDANPYRGRAKR